ncbi:BCS1 N terminal-domain-containing protein [Bisporella sp. PMI_857]|nr:BCS1 N terminal-domain-containing protein [Bisporella sp. PMI_857]
MNQSGSTIYHRSVKMDSTTNFLDPTKPTFNPQLQILETLVPGFSLFSTALYRYTNIDLALYIPAFLVLGLLVFVWGYVRDGVSNFAHTHLMSTASIRVDDEMYNMVMGWIANQTFAKKSRNFVANTNVNSRKWWLFRDDEEDEDEDDDSSFTGLISRLRGPKEKKVLFTPSFGTHYFWYKGWPMIFSRTEDTRQISYGSISERENISISSFGRDPTLLKELLQDCRQAFSKADKNKTIIYRGALKPGSSEPTWTRCVSRVSRPFSTVVLDEEVKSTLLNDMSEYLDPSSRRWYSNRGVPYRRGYLLFGPPGTGKSSLSFAIAGYFKLKIYIVSLNSMAMNEENLSTLFAELPKQCVVLLEDIDTAGLTHSREIVTESPSTPVLPQNIANGGTTLVSPPPPSSRISLSALLNIIDGVAATEGRILIMTTNHIDKLDDALIRPGRVDLTVKFDLANAQMISTIFCGIYATIEGDMPSTKPSTITIQSPGSSSSAVIKQAEEDEKEALRVEEERKRKEEQIKAMGEEIARIIPSMTFSPAEIQGYFLKWKREPEAAVKNAAEWVEKSISDKKKRDIEERERIAREEKEAKEKAEKERLEKEKEGKAEEPKTSGASAEEEKQKVNGANADEVV